MLSISKTFPKIFLSLGTLMLISMQTFFLFSVVNKNSWEICLYCSICTDRKIIEYGELFSLNYRLRIIFLPACNCFFVFFFSPNDDRFSNVDIDLPDHDGFFLLIGCENRASRNEMIYILSVLIKNLHFYY